MAGMRSLLHELIDWIERCHIRRGPRGSPFETQVEPALAAKVEVAYDWARLSGKPVEMYTTTIDPRPLLAGLVLRRSCIDIESVIAGDLDDAAFERLTRCVSEISRSNFRLVQAHPTQDLARRCFFGGPLFALLTF